MSHVNRYVNAIQTLIWALFGLSDAEDVSYPSDAPCDQESCGQKTTELVGVCLYMAYHLVMALVMLNMLIAMMSTSFQEIHVSFNYSQLCVSRSRMCRIIALVK